MSRREWVFAWVAIACMAFAAIVQFGQGVEPHQASTIRILKRQEGFRGEPYRDLNGNLTIGYGSKLPLAEYEADLLLSHRLALAEAHIRSRWQPYAEQPEHVKQALTLMAYQLGVEGELEFQKMFACLERGETSCAAREALDSRWAEQTPQRAKFVAMLLER